MLWPKLFFAAFSKLLSSLEASWFVYRNLPYSDHSGSRFWGSWVDGLVQQSLWLLRLLLIKSSWSTLKCNFLAIMVDMITASIIILGYIINIDHQFTWQFGIQLSVLYLVTYHIISSGCPVPGGYYSDSSDWVHGHLWQSFRKVPNLRHLCRVLQ